MTDIDLSCQHCGAVTKYRLPFDIEEVPSYKIEPVSTSCPVCGKDVVWTPEDDSMDYLEQAKERIKEEYASVCEVIEHSERYPRSLYQLALCAKPRLEQNFDRIAKEEAEKIAEREYLENVTPDVRWNDDDGAS